MMSVDFEFGTLARTGFDLIGRVKAAAEFFGWKRDSAALTHDTAALSSPISADSANTQKSTMFCYSHFRGQGRDRLAEALGADDPFKMLPYEILERVLASGEPPRLDGWQANLWRDTGQVYEIRLARRNFLVAISHGTEEINVQEVRTEAYPSVECSRTARRPSRRPRLAASKINTSRHSAGLATVQTAVMASP